MFVYYEWLSATFLVGIVTLLVWGSYFDILLVDDTGSMYPYFKGGELVFVKTIDKPLNIKEGDIVVFDYDHYEYGGVRIIHRVLYNDFENRVLLTKGDNNLFDDGYISYDDLVFKYWFKVYSLDTDKNFFSWLRKRY